MNERITPYDPELAKSITKEGQRIVRELTHVLEDKISMNKQIRLLAEQCYQTEDPHGQFPREVFNKEKFAELIVRECMSIIKQGEGLGEEDDFDKGFQAGIAMAYNRVRTQMGVEE